MLAQGNAPNVLHREELNAAVLADPVDHGDVGVAESCRGLGLALETEAAFLVVGQLGWQDLERDVAVQFGVEGFPDDAHAAFADLLDQSVVEQVFSSVDGHFAVLPG